MRNLIRLTLLAAGLFISVSGASFAQEKLPAGVLSSGISLFAASDDEAGLEVWRSDGTSRGTFRLTDDACQEHCEASGSFFAPWAVAGNRAFIYAQEDDVSTLWVTDGSRKGTFPVYEGTRIWNLHTPVWVKSQRLLYFIVDTGSFRVFELWRSDGTPEGTRKIKEFQSIDTRGGIRDLTEFRGRVFFNGQDAVNGPALWSSDGTEAGTVLVREFFRDGEDDAGPAWLRVAGSRLLFTAPTPDAGTVLWASDGTRPGTQPLPASVPSVREVQVAGGRLFVSTDQGLWVSDGTRPGTRFLGSFPRPPHLTLESLYKGRYYFIVRNEENGVALWSTDGTREGTRILFAACSYDCTAAAPESLRVVWGQLMISAGLKIHQSDGTLKGTVRIPGKYLVSGSGKVHLAAGRLFFSAYTLHSQTDPPQLWRIHGVKRGAVRLTNFVDAGIAEELMWETPGALLFRIVNEAGRDELWISDGTRPGTHLLKVIRIGE